jgi:hypothetical protein
VVAQSRPGTALGHPDALGVDAVLWGEG